VLCRFYVRCRPFRTEPNKLYKRSQSQIFEQEVAEISKKVSTWSNVRSNRRAFSTMRSGKKPNPLSVTFAISLFKILSSCPLV
jgi:hypothetical protein